MFRANLLRINLRSAQPILRQQAPRFASTAGPQEAKKNDSFLNPKNISIEVTPLLLGIAAVASLGLFSIGRHLLRDPDIRDGPGEIRIDENDEPLKEAIGEVVVPKK